MVSSKQIGTIQIRLNLSGFEAEAIADMCREANSLINTAKYLVRQHYFNTGKPARVQCEYESLDAEMKHLGNRNYRALYSQAAQRILQSVAAEFASFNGLMQRFFEQGGERPHLPRYRKKGGLAPVTYPAQNLEFDLETGRVKLPLGKLVQAQTQEMLPELWIAECAGIKPAQVIEVRILPRNGEFYAEYVYKQTPKQAEVDFNNALGLDPGLSNWLTGVSTTGKSFILDGHQVKSWNQRYNKQVATLQEGKPQGFWSEALAAITEKRNRQMRDAVNKAARFILNWCLSHRIGTVVMGWNPRHKDRINLGRKTNQAFVQLPTARLKARIAQLCEQYGLQFFETEESYTSQASFLDEDLLPTLGEKPQEWKPSGKRGQCIKGKRHNLGRGGYQTAQGWRINADCNGAANILTKVSTQLGLSLAEVGRAVLALPQRYRLDSLSRAYRERREATGLQPVA